MVCLHFLFFGLLGWAFQSLWLAVGRACPKRGKKLKAKRKPLAIRGRLKRRALWRRWREPTPEQRQFAEQCRRENVAHHSPAVEALCGELRSLSVRHRLEEIVFYDGDLFVLVDVWLPDHKIGIEADGLQHRHQHIYDWEKDKMVKEVTGFTIVRRWNSFFLKPGLRDRIVKILGGA